MKQQIQHRKTEEIDFELPECAFRFNYLQAQTPDYAERLVEAMEEDK